MSFLTSYWLLPILFMFHDFEELVFAPTWLAKNKLTFKGIRPFAGVDRADILAGGIWEEFTVYLLISLIAYKYQFPLLIAAAIVPYFLHLIGHILVPLICQTYLPGLITALLELVPTLIYLFAIAKLITAAIIQWLIWIALAIVFFAGNLLFILHIMAKVYQKFTK